MICFIPSLNSRFSVDLVSGVYVKGEETPLIDTKEKTVVKNTFKIIGEENSF